MHFISALMSSSTSSSHNEPYGSACSLPARKSHLNPLHDWFYTFLTVAAHRQTLFWLNTSDSISQFFFFMLTLLKRFQTIHFHNPKKEEKNHLNPNHKKHTQWVLRVSERKCNESSTIRIIFHEKRHCGLSKDKTAFSSHSHTEWWALGAVQA